LPIDAKVNNVRKNGPAIHKKEWQARLPVKGRCADRNCSVAFKGCRYGIKETGQAIKKGDSFLILKNVIGGVIEMYDGIIWT